MLLLPAFAACSKTANDPKPVNSDSSYFPPKNTNEWETRPLSDLKWNEQGLQSLRQFLAQKRTKSFVILVNGRIVVEEYFDGHTAGSSWQWNSAGKTLVTAAIGIAQQEGRLNINTRVSDYLGTGWTNEPADKERLITVRHLLTMTSGINDEKELVIKPNLTYLADAGARWSYHNVFQKLMDVAAAAGNKPFETYFDEKLKSVIGMEGYWNNGIVFNVYHSNTRSMARFGLLALNKGKWSGQQVVAESYFEESTNTSQSINPSYGYLWWLNGKSRYMVPGGQTVYQGALVPNAPPDMYAAMGAEDQRIYVVPSKQMVVVRMGQASDPVNPSFALSGFDNALWEKINELVN